MKKIAMFLSALLLFQNVSLAFVNRTITVTLEKTIPFSFISETQRLEEDLAIKGLRDVKIKSMYVDNGEMTANVSGNYIEVEFFDGQWENSYKTISKVNSLELNDVVLTDESLRSIVITPEDDVKSIYSVSGDFASAKVKPNGNIEVIVGNSAEANMGYDKNSLVKSEFMLEVNDKNLGRKVETGIILPHEIQGKVNPKSGDTYAVEVINVDGNEVNVVFNNGIPIPNENSVNSGHTFFWIDRSEEGIFKKYNPNSVYSTDINKITGNGEYLDESEFDEIGLEVTSSNWTDFCGIEKNGVRYIYVFDESKGIPQSFDGKLVDGNRIEFKEQNFNSEKYSVEFSNAGVSYIPEGKLYSMGELVSNTSGWGEVYPNKSYESTKTFFNEITGKYETYVKHFKFFYGPKEKKTFGGYYTYPYKCTFEYEHYKPIECYSGEVVYEYESREKVKGYSYNGWIKIQYNAEKEINDYPPTAPFNVKYNSSTGIITWNNGSDDYTETRNLMYEIQIFDGNWKSIEKKCFEELILEYNIEYSEPDVRIRTIDEMNQFSDWTYGSESKIELNGKLQPYIVKPGDSINIYADTISLLPIKKLVAKNDEMQMYVELEKTKEITPNFVEVSYDIEADFLEDIDEYLVITNTRIAKGNKSDISNYKFTIDDVFDDGHAYFEFTKEMKMSENGAVIFSNLSYTDIPLDMFIYRGKSWFVEWYNILNIKNKVTNKTETFFRIESAPKLTSVDYNKIVVPEYKIVVNKFEYDKDGNSLYECIDVDKSSLLKPITLTWKTDADGITRFELYSEDKLLYTYESTWEKINTHVNKFFSLDMYKEMKKFSRTGYGYINPSKTERAKWNKIVILLVYNYDLRKFTWLGYRVRKNEYVKQEYIDDYNSNPDVRNNYRLLISDGYMSKTAIKSYSNILKTTNRSMTREDETVFGDDVMEYTSAFEGINVEIPKHIKDGCYEILLTATDTNGEIAETVLSLIVQSDDAENEDVEVEDEESYPDVLEPIIVDKYFGRFFYKNDKGYLEELKKTQNSDTEGFICAGETIGVTLVAENVDYIEVDFLGDGSIKTLDKLTEKFLIDKPAEIGKDTEDIRYQYINFPKKIYPQYVDNYEAQVFKWFYTVPYKTNQTLESWSSLKNSTLEAIDVQRLFERKTEPYSLIMYLNGNRETAIHLTFDVFERWDTILNRDVTEYITNSDTRWEMRIDK